jgi:hypothetical protein
VPRTVSFFRTANVFCRIVTFVCRAVDFGFQLASNFVSLERSVSSLLFRLIKRLSNLEQPTSTLFPEFTKGTTHIAVLDGSSSALDATTALTSVAIPGATDLALLLGSALERIENELASFMV